LKGGEIRLLKRREGHDVSKDKETIAKNEENLLPQNFILFKGGIPEDLKK
jgi:hypothetical protein